MASALMRRSAVTALLAAVATIASPLAGTALAAGPTAPAEKSTSASATATRPTISVVYDQAVTPPSDPTHPSTLILTDNADTANPKTNLCGNATLSTDPSGKTISCTAASDLQDKHTYTYTSHVWDAASSTMDSTFTSSFTTDIPSKYDQSPPEGAVKSSVTSITVSFDEPIATSGGDPNTSNITVDIVNSAGHHVQTSGHTSGSNDPNLSGDPTVPVLGDATWTSDVGGLAPSSYTATFKVFAPTNPSSPSTPNTADWGTATVHFSVDNTMPPAAPVIPNSGVPQAQSPGTGGTAQITQANLKTVHFSGYAPPGFNVAVAIYDEVQDANTFPKATPEGKGSRDGLGTAFVSPNNCSDSITSPTDVKLCHFDVFIDDSKSPDTGTSQTTATGGPSTSYTEHLRWYAYSYSAAGQVPAAPCPTASTTATDPCFNKQDPEILKDSTPPPAPSSADAHWNKSSNSVTVENAHDTDPTTADIFTYRVRVVDPEAHTLTTTTDPGTLANGWTMTTISAFDVSSLDDGQLVVNVSAVDNNGNESAPFQAQTTPGRPSPTAPNYTLVKEAVPTATVPQNSDPSVPFSNSDTVTAGGVTTKFSALSTNNRLKTPSSITVYFNEPIRLVFTDSTDPSNPPVKTFSHICLDDSTGPGSCLNNGVGQYSLTSDKRGLIWTAPAGYQVPADVYDVSAFAIADTCQDATPQNPSPPACEMSQQPGDPLTFFNIDEQPPTVHFTSVPAVDATNVRSTTITGTSDGDTTQIVLSIKSSGGGSTRVVPISTTPNSGGTGTLNWSTTLDLSALPDGTLNLSAVGTDGAGNTTAPANAATATTPLAARPSAPQNLTAAAGNGQAVLTWVAPSYTGGAGVALTGYSLTVTDTSVPGSAPQTFAIDPAATTYTASGLANGHTYSFSLTAANTIGSGPAATASGTPKGNTALSVFASQGTMTFGNFLAVHGTLSYFGVGVANEPVTVSTVYFNGSHGTTYHVTTDQNGNWVIAGLSPAKNVTYVASFAGDSSYNASSGAARVFVRELVRITKVSAANSSHLTSVKLTGNARPSQAGRRIYLYEVLAHGKLRYLGFTKLSSKSTWTFIKAFARGNHTVIARFLSQNGNVGNYSNRVRFSRS